MFTLPLPEMLLLSPSLIPVNFALELDVKDLAELLVIKDWDEKLFVFVIVFQFCAFSNIVTCLANLSNFSIPRKHSKNSFISGVCVSNLAETIKSSFLAVGLGACNSSDTISYFPESNKDEIILALSLISNSSSYFAK